MASHATVEEEVKLLAKEIRERLGTKNADGSYSVTFGTLFKDDKLANMLEALIGTLRAAKKRKVISYQGEMLLQGRDEKVVITLLPGQ